MSSVCIRLGFHEMHARLRGPKSLISLYQIINKTLAYEMAEPRPDMNIKVAAFTVSEKSINRRVAVTNS